MNIALLVNEYIKDKRLSWADSTLKSERARLNMVAVHLNNSPEYVWKKVEGMAPYARRTLFIRLTDFFAYLIERGEASGPNPYRAFMTKNARLFKHVYDRKFPTITFEEAKRRIERIESREVRENCLGLLFGGYRMHELNSRREGRIFGKGGRIRPDFYNRDLPKVGEQVLRLELKKIGLKPHDLRKLFATNLYNNNVNVVDICRAMGWSSFNTASSYIRASDDASLTKMITEVTGG